MAHNDWAQFVIEAGLPGIILLLGAFWWIMRIAMALGSNPMHRPALIALAGGVLVVAVASLFDYPLRAPLFQFACVWLLACLWDFALDNSASETRE